MKKGVYSFEDGKEPKDLKKQIKVLKKQLKVAVEALKEIYVNTKGGRILCDFCHSAVECEGCVNQDVAEKTLKQIKELDK